MSLSFTIRESQRAKHVSLKILPSGALEVVVPSGFDHRRVPGIVQKKRAWIERTQIQIETQQAKFRGTEGPEARPETIALTAIDQKWTITYQPVARLGVKLIERPRKQELVLSGAVDHEDCCHSVLQNWVIDQAQHHLVSWLRKVSREIDLPFTQASVRLQKTRWGSCSSQKNISLNSKLLFLPTELVRYVIIHELCHTVHLNHSPKFWSLVAEYEPHYKLLDAGLRDARYFVPPWMEG